MKTHTRDYFLIFTVMTWSVAVPKHTLVTMSSLPPRKLYKQIKLLQREINQGPSTQSLFLGFLKKQNKLNHL